MRRDKRVKYIVEEDGSFVIQGYNEAKPFSDFLPGVAGPFGIPLWAFFVNRGQGIASFGVDTKDGAIMQFFAANRSYEQTSIKGFRTFVKASGKRNKFTFEPYRPRTDVSRSVYQKMIIEAGSFGIKDSDPSSGLSFHTRFFGIPNDTYAGLAKILTVSNDSRKTLTVEIVDGLPNIVPFGLKEFYLKDMSRTVEAWMASSITSGKQPVAFYKLKSDPEDRPEFQSIDGAHFHSGFASIGKRHIPGDLIVDSDVIFGQNTDLVWPSEFFGSETKLNTGFQITDNKTPCAFAFYKFTLKPGQSADIHSLIGETKDAGKIASRAGKIMTRAYFERKWNENSGVVDSIQNRAATVSDLPGFDQYCRQTFLDNVLRGGLPVKFETKSKDFILNIYSRKHGDLERDYNRFVVQPTYFSQGEGNFRDVNQNRRNDVWFEPAVADANVQMFYDMIQTDGFNPLIVEQVKLQFDSADAVKKALGSRVKGRAKAELSAYLLTPRTPGQIALQLESLGLQKPVQEKIFFELFAVARRWNTARHGEGFWSEHWTYNLDLLESFLNVYPDRLKQTLFGRKDYTYFDDQHRVRPRAEKYFEIRPGVVRQYRAVYKDTAKAELIASRKKDADKVRDLNGRGKVYRTTLASKMLCLIANKIASLDPSGYGVEMESDKPDWYDALNGLPGLFGSAVSGSYELLRLCAFLRSSLEQTGASVQVPKEVAQLLHAVEDEIDAYYRSKRTDKNFRFWDRTHAAKEHYWDKTRFGFSGKEGNAPAAALIALLQKFEKKILSGIRRAYKPGSEVCPTYFSHEVVRFTKKTSSGKTVITPRKFRARRLPNFLEGPVHAMRVETQDAVLKSIQKNVKGSDLYDRKLKMYTVTASLLDESPEIGRCRVFSPGWLENQSVFLHMEYKWLLELIRREQYPEFYKELRNCLVAFQDPAVYGRSIYENSSFIASSAFPNAKYHGTGFVARLSGSTAEFMDMWIRMNVGQKPFRLNASGRLEFALEPNLPDWLFSRKGISRHITTPDGKAHAIVTKVPTYAFTLFSKTVVVYTNRSRKQTFGRGAGKIVEMKIFKTGEKTKTVTGNTLGASDAKALRDGEIRRIEAVIQ